jgi:signal transduction histidine kinase
MQRMRYERSLEENILPKGLQIGPPIFEDPDLIREINQRILTTLIFINLGVLVFSGILGYFLAGKTLTPIKVMLDEQNRFITDASHELKTPLTSLKSAFEVYLRDTGRTKKDADVLVRESVDEVNKLQKLSENLLTLSQFQNNGYIHFETVKLKEILQAAIHRIKPIAMKNKISIKNNDTKLTVYGNKENLTELFVILLDNAIKYSPSNTLVTITTQKTDGKVKVSVSDQGFGISKKDLPSIFDRFFRADNARVKKGAGGYGLGLAIAQKIVRNHNGIINVASTVKGSTFSVTLPRK